MTIDDVDWRQRAACKPIPELFFTGSKERNARAVHICRNHCPVLSQCRDDAIKAKPAHCVQAGIVWVGSKGHIEGRMGANQPKPHGCGSECAR
jgi:hypothetical protein